MTKLSTLLFLLLTSPAFASAPEIQLANIYHEGIDVSQYLVSEKLDGVRGYWDGENLVSREGKVFSAPEFFTKDFPKETIEGELWTQRGRFEEASSIVNTQDSSNQNWRKIKFMLFDMPKHRGTFEQRLQALHKIAGESHSPFLQVIKQEEISNHKQLIKKLHEVVNQAGEGLMLHRKSSLYQAQRNDDLLKLKTYLDAEATVIGYVEGKGKYEGLLGALLVRTPDNIEFKIGGGLSDEQRQSPPPINSVITYKYFGLTKNGKPRFASFMRIKK